MAPLHKHLPHRRCHWYENDGSPRAQYKSRDKGCIYPHCSFIHPSDPEWPTAIKSRPELPPVNTAGDVDRDRDRDRERYRDSKDMGERDRERDWEKDRDRDRDRPRERDRDWRREREGARSPRAPSSGPSTSASPSKVTRSRRASGSSSSAVAPNATSSNNIPLGGSSPQKYARTSTLAPRDNASTTMTSVTTRVRSPSLNGNSATSASRPREPNFSFDRGGYRDRDKSPSTPADARSQPLRYRQNSTASATAGLSPTLKHSVSSTVATSMPPPPPTLNLATPQPSTTFSPTPLSSQHLTVDKKPTVIISESVPGPTRQDKIQMWVDRIKQLSDAVQVRTQHVALERELVQLKALLNSRPYASISDAVREKLEKQVKATEERYIAKRLELNDAVYKLVDSEFWDASMSWPSFDANTAKTDLKGKGKEREPGWGRPEAKASDAEERFADLRGVVWRVRDGVDELYKMMAELQGTTGTQEERTTKRPRVDNSMAVDDIAVQPSASTPSTSLPTTSSLPLPTRASSTPSQELESIIDRLNAIDDKISDLENIMVQFDSDVLNELNQRLEERLQGLNLGSNDSEERMAIDDGGLDTGQQSSEYRKTVEERLQLIEKEMERGGQDITGIAIEIAEIITKAQQTDDEVTRLKRENEEMRDRIAMLEKQGQENVETMKAFRAEMEALNAALQTFISRPTSPPPAPPPRPEPPSIDPLPDMQVIIDTVGPLVLGSVREDIVPMLEDLKESVQAMMTRQNTQLAQNVMNKLQLTFKTVEVIYAWMNRTVASQMPPPPTPTGGPSTVSPLPQGPVVANGVTHATSMNTTSPNALGSAGRVSTPILTIRNGVPPQVPQTPHMVPAKPVPQ